MSAFLCTGVHGRVRVREQSVEFTVSQCVYMHVLIFFMFDGRTHYAKRCFLILINLYNNKSCLSCKVC